MAMNRAKKARQTLTEQGRWIDLHNSVRSPEIGVLNRERESFIGRIVTVSSSRSSAYLSDEHVVVR